MQIEWGFCSGVAAGGSASSLPVGAPKKKTGRFIPASPLSCSSSAVSGPASQKRPRSPTAEEGGDTRGSQNEHANATANTDVVLGPGGGAEPPTVPVRLLPSSHSTTKRCATKHTISPQQLNHHLQRQFSGVGDSGGERAVAMETQSARHAALQELCRSNAALRMRVATEELLRSVYDGGLPTNGAVTAEQRRARGEVLQMAGTAAQGLLPTLVFESIAMRNAASPPSDQHIDHLPSSSLTPGVAEPLLPAWDRLPAVPSAVDVASLLAAVNIVNVTSPTVRASDITHSSTPSSFFYSPGVAKRLRGPVHDLLRKYREHKLFSALDGGGCVEERGEGVEGPGRDDAIEERTCVVLSAAICAVCAAFSPSTAGPDSTNDNLSVSHSPLTGEVTFGLRQRRHRISGRHYRKLAYLFRCARPIPINAAEGSEAAEELLLHWRMFTMLERYFGLSGCQTSLQVEGGWHAALPCAVFGALARAQGVSLEAFASPLNTSSTVFGSAFVDVDCFFGSIGSFFDVFFTAGAMEVNPPFDPVVAVRLVHHIEAMLRSRQQEEDALQSREGDPHTLTFTITVPVSATTGANAAAADSAAADPPVATAAAGAAPVSVQHAAVLPSAEAFVDLIRQSPFLLAEAVLAGSATPYRDGCEAVVEGAHFKTRFGTLVAVLGFPVSTEAKTMHCAALADTAAVWASI